MAVLEEKFRLQGTTGLKVVDASIFPTIPGFYTQTSIYNVTMLLSRTRRIRGFTTLAPDCVIERHFRGPVDGCYGTRNDAFEQVCTSSCIIARLRGAVETSES